MLETVELLENATLVLHFIGMASLLGGFLVQIKALKTRTARIIPAMIHGSWTALITGLLLVALHEWMSAIDPEAGELDNLKIAVKSIVVAIIVVLVMINRKKDTVKGSTIALIGALTLLNIVTAVFW